MAGISAQATTFNVVNYTGEVIQITPDDTPLTTMMGNLYGGEPVQTTIFEWQETDLRAAGQNVAKEGADFPTPQARTRTNVKNVLQIVHEGIEVSDTKQGASGQVQDVGSSHTGISSTGEGNPVTSELDFQVGLSLKQIARDMEYSVIQGSFVEPADNDTERKTRGLISAISTNAFDVSGATVALSASSSSDDILIDAGHGLENDDKIQFTALTGGAGLALNTTYYVVNATTGTFQLATSAGGTPVNFTTDISAADYETVADVTADNVLDLLQSVWDNGGIQESETATLIANSWNKRKLSNVFLSNASGTGFRQDERTVGGVNLQTLHTDFGVLNIMLNRHVPANTILVASVDQLRLKFMDNPGGYLRAEPLARQGIASRVQISGEFGLKWGNQRAHGKLTGLSTR